MEVNGIAVPVGLVLDSTGLAYFPTQGNGAGQRQYRFWSALLGMVSNRKFLYPSHQEHRINRLGVRFEIVSVQVIDLLPFV